MKKYIPKPGVPNPTPAPGAKEGNGRVYIGGSPNFAGLNPRLKPKPSPKPKPNVTTNQGGGKKKKRVIVGGGKEIGPAKKSQVSDEEIMPKKFPKPKGNRRRLLDEINKMNKKAGY